MFDHNDIIYISGPMSGIPDANRAAFNAAEKYLADEFGCKILNPARHEDGLNYAQYMELAMLDVSCCTKVVTLPGVQNSMGACFEIFVAGLKLHKPVYSLFEVQHRHELAPEWCRPDSPHKEPDFFAPRFE